MLSAKPWKLDAIVRLGLSVIICVFIGSLANSAFHYLGAGGKISPWFFLLVAGAAAFLVATLILIRRPWSPEYFMRRVMILLISFYAGFLLGVWAEKVAGPLPSGMTGGQMLIAGLSFHGMALILIGRFLREHQVNWTEAFGLNQHWARAVLLGALLACVFLPAGVVLQSASARLMKHWSLTPHEQAAVEALRTSVGWTYRLSLGLVAILLAPAAEEMLFRGILYPAVKQAGYPRLALWGAAALFAAMHLNLETFVPLMVLALFLTALYENTNNLLAPIATHVLFNSMNFVMLYWQQKLTR